MSSNLENSPPQKIVIEENVDSHILESSADISYISSGQIGNSDCSNIGNIDTPCKNAHSLTSFKRGVFCSSTPVHPNKKLKLGCDSLSIIHEVDPSDEEDSVTIVESENRIVLRVFTDEVKNSDTAVEYNAMFELSHLGHQRKSVTDNTIAPVGNPHKLISQSESGSNEGTDVLGNQKGVLRISTDEESNITVIKKPIIAKQNVFGEIRQNNLVTNKNIIPEGHTHNLISQSKGGGPNGGCGNPGEEGNVSADSLIASVLQKDELSMIIEMPHSKMITMLDNMADKSNKDSNDLTLQVNKELSVTYRNVKEKTIDDGNLISDDVDVLGVVCLDHEPDRDQIIQKGNNLKDFISNNEDENKDNCDPEWELLKKLDSDDERYKAVRKIWKNLTIPDPTENLSIFNWRKKNCLGPLKNITTSESYNKALIKLPTNKVGQLSRCTEIFDRGIQNLSEFVDRRKKGMDIEKSFEYSILESLNNPSSKMTLEKIYECIRERLDRHRAAKEEVEAVHKFYNGLQNREENSTDLLFLSPSEHREALDVEDMISSYSYWYRK